MRRFLTLLFACCLHALAQDALAQEQYRSRMYIDLDIDASENVSLSVSELEKSVQDFQDAGTRASAEKFLAQHYAGEKDYAKAAQHLEGALRNPALPAAERKNLLGQLARAQLLLKNNEKAAQALQDYLKLGDADADVYLLLAQVQYQRKQYVAASEALDRALALQKTPAPELLRSALAVYYQSGNLERAAAVMQQLVARDSNNAELWLQWIALYLKAGKQAQALDVMALAWEMGLPFREQDVLLLADLYAINKIPARGAHVLEEALASGRLKSSGKLNDRLFRLWMQAGERDKAQLALQKAAASGGDTELQLHLAQLLMEKQDWAGMQAQVLRACDGALPERLVARANLLLGISQLKLGDSELARRSLINATIVGGAGAQASEWLAYMKAESPSKRELAGIAGPCYSEDTRSIFAAALPESKRGAEQADEQNILPANAITVASAAQGMPKLEEQLAQVKGDAQAPLEIKTVTAQTLYLGTYTFAQEQMEEKILPLAVRAGIAITKGGGRIAGPFYLIFPGPPTADGRVTFKLGFPVEGNPRAVSPFKLVQDRGFRCVARRYEGSKEGVMLAYVQLQADAMARGLVPTGESRQLAGNENIPGSATVSLELQVGVR